MKARKDYYFTIMRLAHNTFCFRELFHLLGFVSREEEEKVDKCAYTDT